MKLTQQDKAGTCLGRCKITGYRRVRSVEARGEMDLLPGRAGTDGTGQQTMMINKETKAYGRSLPVVAGCKNEAKTKPFWAGKRAFGGRVEIVNGLIIHGNMEFWEVLRPVDPGG